MLQPIHEFFRVEPNRPDPIPKESAMRYPRFALVAFLVLFCLAVIHLAGCTAPTAAQLQGASGTLAATGATLQGASTQPSALGKVVGVTEAVAPVTTPYITMAGIAISALSLIVGAIGGSTTTAASKNKTIAQYATAIGEVVNDVAEYKQPGVSYTANTEKLVSDVAGIVAAAPVVPATTTINLTAEPSATATASVTGLLKTA